MRSTRPSPPSATRSTTSRSAPTTTRPRCGSTPAARSSCPARPRPRPTSSDWRRPARWTPPSGPTGSSRPRRCGHGHRRRVGDRCRRPDPRGRRRRHQRPRRGPAAGRQRRLRRHLRAADDARPRVGPLPRRHGRRTWRHRPVEPTDRPRGQLRRRPGGRAPQQRQPQEPDDDGHLAEREPGPPRDPPVGDPRLRPHREAKAFAGSDLGRPPRSARRSSRRSRAPSSRRSSRRSRAPSSRRSSRRSRAPSSRRSSRRCSASRRSRPSRSWPRDLGRRLRRHAVRRDAAGVPDDRLCDGQLRLAGAPVRRDRGRFLDPPQRVPDRVRAVEHAGIAPPVGVRPPHRQRHLHHEPAGHHQPARLRAAGADLTAYYNATAIDLRTLDLSGSLLSDVRVSSIYSTGTRSEASWPAPSPPS